jgi:RNA polymerase sigma-70 factor (ECF subfamily)
VDDKQIITLILEGNAEAREAFYTQNYRRLYVAAAHFLGYKDPEAEDAVQETLLKAYQALPQFQGRSSLYTWLNQICVNICLQRLDQRQKRIEVLDTELEGLSQSLALQEHHDQVHAQETQEKLKAMHQALETLPEPCQSLLRGHYLQGHSMASLAEKHKMPMGSVMGRMARCREALKQKLLKALQPRRKS